MSDTAIEALRYSEFPNSSDCISRQAAIDTIMGQPPEPHYPSWYAAQIEKLPAAQPEQRWIPCSERLPELGQEALVCYDFKGHRSVLIGCLYGDGKFHGYDDEYLTHNGRKYRKAVAWMPLPEPWRGDSICK